MNVKIRLKPFLFLQKMFIFLRRTIYNSHLLEHYDICTMGIIQRWNWGEARGGDSPQKYFSPPKIFPKSTKN